MNRLPSRFLIYRCLIVSAFAAVILTANLFAQTRSSAVYIPYAEAQPILQQLDEILPPGLKGKSSTQQSVIWSNWVAGRDKDIRARLLQGDEDSIVNFLLFGTSYTTQPRLNGKQLAQITSQGTAAGDQSTTGVQRILNARIDDLIKGAAAPKNNERLLFAERVMTQKGFNLRTPAGMAQAKDYLLASLGRVLKESASYTRILEQAKQFGDASEEFAQRSHLFSNRGLSSDTSLLPNFALEQSLKAMRDRHLIDAPIRRIAIIGPGLDFTDKEEGYDFYPQQTIQPFAIIDSVLRLGLAQANNLQLTTFDISPRINDHLARANRDAARGQSYTLQLPRNVQAGWKPDAVTYWSHFGDQIAVPVTAIPAPSATGELVTRAVRVRPEIVSRIAPSDLNIVLQRLDLPESQRFDLIIATNIFIYYDVFEQSLCLRNVEAMLRRGGFLLTNNGLLELPSSGVHSVDYLTVVYSDRPDDGDHIVWYQRAPS
jgi:hypothetical protein